MNCKNKKSVREELHELKVGEHIDYHYNRLRYIRNTVSIENAPKIKTFETEVFAVKQIVRVKRIK